MANQSVLEGLLQSLNESKGENIWVYHVKDHVSYTDEVIVLTSLSGSHTRALIDKTHAYFKELKRNPYIQTRKHDSYQWAVLDYGSIIIHYFQEEEREFYGLDEHFQKILPQANHYLYPRTSSQDHPSIEELHEPGI